MLKIPYQVRNFIQVHLIWLNKMDFHYSDEESNGSENSVDIYDYPAPTTINLAPFLNSNYKWETTVDNTDCMQSYVSLRGKITNLNFPDEDKVLVMYFITNDIVQRHKHLIPHWKLLNQHALFSRINIYN